MKRLNITNRIYTLLVVAMLAASVGLRAESVGNDTARQVVVTLQDALIQAMQQGQKIGYSGRQKLLAPVIEQTHDLTAIIRSVLGGYWTKLDSSMQQAIIKAFQADSIATYADRFNQYSGEQFRAVEQTQLPRGRVLIRSQLVRVNDNPVNFDYVLHEVDGSWRIINIIVDGVSDLAMKRAEYGAVLQKDGAAALVGMLEQKTARIEQQNRK